MVIRDALLKAEEILKSGGIESARLDAQVLLAYTLQQDRVFLHLQKDLLIEPRQEKAYFDLIQKRAQYVPVAYLTGTKEFMSLEFCVTPDTLIPRPDTEILVEAVLEQLKPVLNPHVIDLGTGSGAIAVSLAYYHQGLTADAVDVSSGALNAAQENARRHGAGGRISFYRADMLSDPLDFGCLYDAVVSNPPYITKAEMAGLMEDVIRYEPEAALCGGEDGLLFYRAILSKMADKIKKQGLIAFEIGYNIGDEVCRLLKESEKFESVRMLQDLAGLDRVVLARRTG